MEIKSKGKYYILPRYGYSLCIFRSEPIGPYETIVLFSGVYNACRPHAYLSLNPSQENVAWNTDNLSATAFPHITNAMTLANVLSKTPESLTHRQPEARLVEVEFRTLGVSLTSAVLQLYSITWLANRWSTAESIHCLFRCLHFENIRFAEASHRRRW